MSGDAEPVDDASDTGSFSVAPGRRRALYAVMVLAILVASLIDIPRAQRAGPMTWLGLITIVESALGAAALLAAAYLPRRVRVRVAVYGAFVAWTALSVSWAPPLTQGLQNAAVYLMFGILLTVAAVAAAEDRAAVERVIGRSMIGADVVGLGLVAASLALRGWPTDIDHRPWLVHPRALALFGLVPLSWHLARWTLGRERSALGASLWVAAIFVSLSRTATAIALLLVVLAVLARKRTVKLTVPSRLLLFALVPVAIAGVLTITPFRNRLFVRTDRSVSINDLQLRDNGRAIMWRAVAKSALESPILGKGLGTSESTVSDTYYWVGHPHNDYLRVWHDLGLVGLALLVTAFAIWWRILWTEWRRLARHTISEPTLQLAALGALAALALGMLTDNPLVYGFVMAPSAVVIGAGLGARSTFLRRRRRRRHIDGTQAHDLRDDVASEEPGGLATAPEPLPKRKRIPRRR